MAALNPIFSIKQLAVGHDVEWSSRIAYVLPICMPHFAVVVCSHGIKLKGCGIKTQNLVTFILGFIFAWKDKLQGLFQNNQTVVFGNVFSFFGEKATKPRTNVRRPGAMWEPSFLLLINPGFTPDCAPNPSQTCPYLAQTPEFRNIIGNVFKGK